ncbi:nuclear transport factor 2 family protein [Streptomyces sp. NPDC014991]|uniref:nuclear transport factor 2 family protein n=1 Tax=Streptomyces sp. NPDC014991 TaxID=3364935 RepID=UPI0036F5F3BE
MVGGCRAGEHGPHHRRRALGKTAQFEAERGRRLFDERVGVGGRRQRGERPRGAVAPGFPPCFEGREALRAGHRAAWGAGPARVREIRQVAVLGSADPEVLVAEHVVVGTLPPGETAFSVPGLPALHVRDGLLIRVRDHMDGADVAAARA